MELPILVKNSANIYESIPPQEIKWIESDGHDCIIYCEGDKTFRIKLAISKMEQQLANYLFFRIRRTVIVNRAYVTKVDKVKGQVYLSDTFFSIGETFKSNVYEQFLFLG